MLTFFWGYTMSRSLLKVALLGALSLSGSVQAKDAWRTVFEDRNSMTVQVNESSVSYREEGLSVFGTGEVRVLEASGQTRMKDVAKTQEIWMRVEVDCGGTLRYRILELARLNQGKKEPQAVTDRSWHPYTVSTPEESFGYAICEPGEGAG